MRKKGIILVLTVMLGAIVAIAADVAFEVFVPEVIIEREYIPETDDVYKSVQDPMYTLLKNAYGDGEALWDATKKYADFKAADKPTKEELLAIYSSMEKTNDIYAVIKVYKFWEKTNDGIDVYTGIMNRYSTELAKSEYWFEDVYNELTNNKHGVLDEQDVQEYIEDGVRVEDISVANVLSRRGIYTITKILDLRKDNRSWAYITAEIFPEYEYSSAHDEISGIDVLDAQYLEKRTDSSMSYYFDIAVKEGTLETERQKYFSKATADVKKVLMSENLWDYSEEEKQNIEIRRQGVLRTAEANGIPPETFAMLEATGESEMDILNASLIVKEKGVTAEQAVNEVKTQEGAVER